MNIVLKPEMFTNNKLSVSYGDREALFTIVDEEFFGRNRLGKINRMVILVRKLSTTGQVLDERQCTTIIGMGDGFAGIKSDNPMLRGKLMNKDNMEECVVELYEDE